MARKRKAKTADEMWPVAGPPPSPPPRVEAPTDKTAQAGGGNTAKLPDHKPDGDFAPGNQYVWKPGQSGNPNGRPKNTTEMKQRAASLTDLALDVLEMAVTLQRRTLEKAMEICSNAHATVDELDWARGVIEKDAMQAAQALLDRGHGKPQQKVEVDLASIFDEMDDDEVAEYLTSVGSKVTADLLARRKARK